MTFSDKAASRESSWRGKIGIGSTDLRVGYMKLKLVVSNTDTEVGATDTSDFC